MKIISGVTVLAFVFLALPLVSSLSYVNVYVDDAGNAQFYGSSDQVMMDLPAGIILEDRRIRGETDSLTSKEKDIWRFSLSLGDSELKIILPENTIVSNISKGELYIEKGRFVVYAYEETSFNYYFKQERSSFSYLYFVIFVILVLFIAAFFYRRTTHKKTGQKYNMEMIKSILSERENKILDNLKKYGKIKMSYLRKVSDIPKASFSRHVQELEKKGIVKRSGEGKNKFVDMA